MLYVLKFKPVYKDYIWGGKNLLKFGKKISDEKIAESWELSCHQDGMSTVENGIYKGRSLKSIINEFGDQIIGDISDNKFNDFPLLVKFIDANDKLSVQVHPNDEYAMTYEGGYGKNEMWYILDAKPKASLIYGLKTGVTRAVFEKAVEERRVHECLNYINVKAGDFINIPTGMVHAIGEGIILAEIQQNSNTTYRIYDYDRQDSNGNYRPLHMNKAMQVINFDSANTKLYEGLEYRSSKEGSFRILVANRYFCVELYSITGNIQQNTEHRQFHIYICIDGSGKICWGNDSIILHKGDTVLVPACIGKYYIKGQMKLLKSYVPNIDIDVFNRLINIGFEKREIIDKISGLK